MEQEDFAIPQSELEEISNDIENINNKESINNMLNDI